MKEMEIGHIWHALRGEHGIINWMLTDGGAAGSFVWNGKLQVAAAALSLRLAHRCSRLYLSVFVILLCITLKVLSAPLVRHTALAPGVFILFAGPNPFICLGLGSYYTAVVPKLMLCSFFLLSLTFCLLLYFSHPSLFFPGLSTHLFTVFHTSYSTTLLLS